MIDLPAELWTQIFDLAADEDVLFAPGLPGVSPMAESAWFKNFHGAWSLRTPGDAVEMVQRRSYATKKAIVRTCKRWREIGSEFLFRCLFFSDPGRLVALANLLDASAATSSTAATSTDPAGSSANAAAPPLGWWTRRIHVTRFYASHARGTTPILLQDALIRVIRHCPNLQIFIVNWPLTASTFGPVADALAVHARGSLSTLAVTVPAGALGKVIWALEGLRRVGAVHIELEYDGQAEERGFLASSAQEEDYERASVVSDDPALGAAGDIRLTLPNLQQLSLKGHIQQFVEQASGWDLPVLRHLSVDCPRTTDLPDVVCFLTAHGPSVIHLDLEALPSLPVQQILARCPELRTMTFNGDWRIVGAEDDSSSSGPSPPLAHDKLMNVGLSGLSYAFGVGFGAADGVSALVATSVNDRTIQALCDKTAFPSLHRLRVLSRGLLMDLEKADGPSTEGGGMSRWERWWSMTAGAGVRLEDCTGALLGELPQDLDDGDFSDDDDSDEEDDEDEAEVEEQLLQDGWKHAPTSNTAGSLNELRKLLEECRAMDRGRDDNYLHRSAAGAMMIPGFSADDTGS